MRVVKKEEVEAEPGPAKRPVGRPKGTCENQQGVGEGPTPAEPVHPHLELHDAMTRLVNSQVFEELLSTVSLWWFSGAGAQLDDD